MGNIIPTFRYIWLTIRHKWFVFRAGFRTRAKLWDLLIHDWSKFTAAELPHYGRQFFGSKGDPAGFSRAWLHHQNVNRHHWEYWIPRSGHNRGGQAGGQPVEMPERYVREMVADWLGASRAYNGVWPADLGSWKWLHDNFDAIQVHPTTRTLLGQVLREVFAGPE